MNSNFRPPPTGIKQINPMSGERQLMGLKRETTPGGGPLTLPTTRPSYSLPKIQMDPLRFKRLRAMFAQGK